MDVTFIIINWNTCNLVLDCLDSIFNTVKGCEYEVFVVDNGSSDGSVQKIKDRFGRQVTVIENHENLGFARANNQALRLARGKYFVLLNSDTLVEHGAIDALVLFLEENPSVAIAGPRLVDKDGTLQNSYDNFPTLVSELTNKSLLRFFFPGRFPGKVTTVSSPFEVDSLIGACMAVRADAVQQVGLLDEDFFFFLEETDWCFRMRKAGWKIFHCPHIRIIHLQGQSKRQSPARAWVEYYRSLYLFFKKNRSTASYFILRIFRVVKLTVNLALTLLGLCLTAGTKKRLREKTGIYLYLLWWHVNLCPDTTGLKKL